MIRPPRLAIERFTTSMPTPRPERSETTLAVEKPGRNSRLSISAFDSALSAGMRPFVDGDLLDALAVDAGAVVGDLDQDAARAVLGRQPHHALSRLAGGDALVRPLEPVVDRVANHVGQRVGEALDDGLVDLGHLALGDQAHLLAGRVGRLAHDARHALEQRLDRLGADRQHAFLHFAGQMLELVEADGDGRTSWRGPTSITDCDSIAWLMTSSPTRLIRRSTRSRSTRTVDVAPDRRAWSPSQSPQLWRRRGRAGADGSGGPVGCGSFGAGLPSARLWHRDCHGRRRRSAIANSQSPSTKSKISRTSALGTVASSSTSQARYDWAGSKSIELRNRGQVAAHPAIAQAAELAQQRRGLVATFVERPERSESDAVARRGALAGRLGPLWLRRRRRRAVGAGADRRRTLGRGRFLGPDETACRLSLKA